MLCDGIFWQAAILDKLDILTYRMYWIMVFTCLGCCCMGTGCHCALPMWWTVRPSRVILGTLMYRWGCSSFVWFVLDSEQGHCSQVLHTVPSWGRHRGESLWPTEQIQAVKFNPKWDQASKVRKRSMRRGFVNLYWLSYSHRNNLMTPLCQRHIFVKCLKHAQMFHSWANTLLVSDLNDYLTSVSVHCHKKSLSN